MIVISCIKTTMNWKYMIQHLLHRSFLLFLVLTYKRHLGIYQSIKII
jgi:hypothetical protein